MDHAGHNHIEEHTDIEYPQHPRRLADLIAFDEELEYGDFAQAEGDELPLVESDFDMELAGQLHRRTLEVEHAMSIKTTLRRYHTTRAGLSQLQRHKRVHLFGRNLAGSSRSCHTLTKKFRVQALGASGAFAYVRVAGTLTMLRLTELVPGDVIELFAGCQVPATVRIIESRSLCLAAMTGHRALGVLRRPQEAQEEAPPVEMSCTFALMGSFVSQGTGVGLVVRTGAGVAQPLFLRQARDVGSAEASAVRLKCLDFGTSICDNHSLQQFAQARSLVVSLETLFAPERCAVQHVAYNLAVSREPAPHDASWKSLCRAALYYTPLPLPERIDEESKAQAPPEMTPGADCDYCADFAHRAAVEYCRGFQEELEESVEVWRGASSVVRFFPGSQRFVYYECGSPHELLLRCATMVEGRGETPLTPAKTLQLLRMASSMEAQGVVQGFAFCALDADKVVLCNHGSFAPSGMCFAGALGVRVALLDDCSVLPELCRHFDRAYLVCASLGVQATRDVLQRAGLSPQHFRMVTERDEMLSPNAYSEPQERIGVFTSVGVTAQDRQRVLRALEGRPTLFVMGVSDDLFAVGETVVRAVAIRAQLLRGIAQAHLVYRSMSGLIDALLLVRSMPYESAEWTRATSRCAIV